MSSSIMGRFATRVLLRAQTVEDYAALQDCDTTTITTDNSPKNKLLSYLANANAVVLSGATKASSSSSSSPTPITRGDTAAAAAERPVFYIGDVVGSSTNMEGMCGGGGDDDDNSCSRGFKIIEMNPRDGMEIDTTTTSDSSSSTTIVVLAPLLPTTTPTPTYIPQQDDSSVTITASGMVDDTSSSVRIRLDMISKKRGTNIDQNNTTIATTSTTNPLPTLFVSSPNYYNAVQSSSSSVHESSSSSGASSSSSSSKVCVTFMGVACQVSPISTTTIDDDDADADINTTTTTLLHLHTDDAGLFAKIVHVTRREYNVDVTGRDVLVVGGSGGGVVMECTVPKEMLQYMGGGGWLHALFQPLSSVSNASTSPLLLRGIKIAPIIPAPLRGQYSSEASMWSSLRSYLQTASTTGDGALSLLYMRAGDILSCPHSISTSSSISCSTSGSSSATPDELEDRIITATAEIKKNLTSQKAQKKQQQQQPLQTSGDEDGDQLWRPSITMEGLGGSDAVYHFQIVSILLDPTTPTTDGVDNHSITNGGGGSGGWFSHGDTKISIDDCSPLPGPVAVSPTTCSPDALIDSVSGLLTGTTFVTKLAQSIQSEFLRPALLHMDHTATAEEEESPDIKADTTPLPSSSSTSSSSYFPHITIGIIEAGAQSNLPIEHCMSAAYTTLLLPTVCHDCQAPGGGYTSKVGETTTISSEEAAKYGVGGGNGTSSSSSSGLGVVPCLAHLTTTTAATSSSNTTSMSPTSSSSSPMETAARSAASRPTVLIINHCELLDSDPVQLNAIRTTIEAARGYLLVLLIFVEESGGSKAEGGGGSGGGGGTSAAKSMFKNMAALELKLESATKESDRELILGRLFGCLNNHKKVLQSSETSVSTIHNTFQLHPSHTLSPSLLASWTTGFTAGDLIAFFGSTCHSYLASNIRSHFGHKLLTTSSPATTNTTSTINVFLTDEFVADRLGAYQRSHGFVVSSTKLQPVKWSDVGGLEDVKKEILETIRLPTKYPHLFKKSGGLKRKMGILLFGPPGCGKTLLAKAVATEMAMNFLSVKGPELINQYVGESERNVRDVFQRARDNSPCVLFFDELDALAPARGAKGDAGGAMDRIVSQLLVEMDGAAGDGGGEVFLIAATNRPDMLDAALLRPGRLDQRCYLGPPETKADTLLALKALTRKFEMSDDVDLEEIAGMINDSGIVYTGADMFALCSDAMILGVETHIAAMLAREMGDSNDASPHEEEEDTPPPNGTAVPTDASDDKEEDKVVGGDSVVADDVNKVTSEAAPPSNSVKVTMAHFKASLAKLTPSVTPAEFEQYKQLRDSINGK